MNHLESVCKQVSKVGIRLKDCVVDKLNIQEVELANTKTALTKLEYNDGRTYQLCQSASDHTV